MGQPFVVSLKLVTDNAQGVRGIEEERAAIVRLGNTVRGLNSGPQVRIDQMLGLGRSQDTAQRAADIAAYGAGLDDLRAKFNPLFAAERQHAVQLEEIAQARRVGAISIDEEIAAVARAKAGYDQLTKSIIANENSRVPGHAGSGAFQTANIAAQFQDIGVTTAMGMNPLQIALQQGTQLSAILGPMGATGVVKGLGQAFLSIVNPVSLVTIGVIAAGAAGVQWLMSLRGNVKTADEALKGHEEIIGEIKSRWEGAEGALDRYSKRNQSLVAAGARENVTQLKAQLNTALDDFMNDVAVTMSRKVFGVDAFLIKKDFLPFSDAIKQLRDEAKAGAPDFDAFYRSVNTAVTADASLKGVGDKLVTASNNAESFWRNLQAAGVAADVAEDRVTALVNATFGLLGQDKTAGFALDSRVQGEQAAAAHRIELDAINAKSPAQLADIARRRMALELDGEAITEALRLQKIEEAGALAYAQASHGIADASIARLRAANDNIASAQLDLNLIGRSIEESERLRFVRQQLSAAELEAAQTGTTVSAAYRAEIERLGEAYGKLQHAIALSKMSDDLKFARDQLGRTSAEQGIASQLRSVFGNDIGSDQAQFYAAQMRVNESLTQTRDLLSGVTQGILSDLKSGLMQGTSLFETLGNAGVNALSRIGERALAMAGEGIVNMIMQAILGGSTGSAFRPGGWGSTAFSLPRNARGTDSWRGGLTSINEEGGEILNLPRGTKIIPHDVSMEMARSTGGGGSGGFTYQDNRSYSIGDGVDLAQLRQILDADRQSLLAELPGRIAYARDNPRRVA